MSDDPASLDRMHDVVAPAPVPWWPPAPGWYWVLGLAAVLAFAWIIRSCIRWQRNAYRREALAEWQRGQALLADPSRRTDALIFLAELLKRTALSAFPRREVASLTGSGWHAFLNRTGRGSFSAESCSLLEQAAYDPGQAAAAEDQKCQEAAVQVRHWLKRHTVKGGPSC